jgi:hypothetical protein
MPADPSVVSGWEKAVFGAIGAVIGVVLGFLLNELKNAWTRSRKHRAYWSALRAETEFAKGRAQMYIDDRKMAPLYRLPDTCFRECYPELLADGALSEAESTALMAFYAEVDTLNRGLDRAAEAPDEEKMKREYGRNLLKAERLIQNGPLYVAVASAIRGHVKETHT